MAERNELNQALTILVRRLSLLLLLSFKWDFLIAGKTEYHQTFFKMILKHRSGR